jgi:hypothetical protein
MKDKIKKYLSEFHGIIIVAHQNKIVKLTVLKQYS